MRLSDIARDTFLTPETVAGKAFAVLSARTRTVGAGKKAVFECAFSDKTIQSVAFPLNDFLKGIIKGLREAQAEYKDKNPKGSDVPQLGPVTAEQDGAGFWILRDVAQAAQARK